MSNVVRFGVSLQEDLLKRFDKLIKEKNYPNRSEALRDMIRRELVKKQWKAGRDVAGAVTLVYDHHRRDLLNRITDVQHDYQNVIVSAQHVHLDLDNCLEIIAVKGNPKDVQKLSDTLGAIKGVKHGTLSMSSAGRGIS